MAPKCAAPRLAPGSAADSTRALDAGAKERGPRIITRFGSRSRDWYVRSPAPDRALNAWLRQSRGEWNRCLSISRNVPCENCGRPTDIARISGRRRRAWCSGACSQAWYNKQRPKVQHVEKPCTCCGTSFQPARADARFCSSACRQAAYRQRRAEFSASRNSPVTIDVMPEPARSTPEPAPLELVVWMFERHRCAPVWGAA